MVKLVGYGGWWLVALASLIVAYAVGTSVLQWAYQRSGALIAAGLATMAANALPIAAGVRVVRRDAAVRDAGRPAASRRSGA